MSDELSSQARRMIVGRYPHWIKPFDVNEYLENRPLIEKLHEEKQLALASTLDLETKVASLNEAVHQLDLEKQQLIVRLEEADRKSSSIFFFTLLAAILLGIGVNLVTNEPTDWIGWVLIVSAVVIEILAFNMSFKHKENKNGE